MIKLICIKKGKILSQSSTPIKCSNGEIYDAELDYEIVAEIWDGYKFQHIYIIHYNTIYYGKFHTKYFMPLAEYRDEQINKLLND